MSDEARKQYTTNHPVWELYDRLQWNTGPFEQTHPQLDTRFLSVFQKRLSDRFHEIRLQMGLKVKLSYYTFTGRVPRKFGILTTQESVAVKSLQEAIATCSEVQQQCPKYSTEDFFDLVAIGVTTDQVDDKLDDLRKSLLLDLNDGNTIVAVYHLLAEHVGNNMVIFLFTLATKKDAFVYIKGGKHSYLNNELTALRCASNKLALTFLLVSEGPDSAIWSDDMDYLELVSGNGLHSQTLFSKKSSYQHIVFAFGEFPVTAGQLGREKERRVNSMSQDASGADQAKSPWEYDEHSITILEKHRESAKIATRTSDHMIGSSVRDTSLKIRQSQEPVIAIMGSSDDAIGGNILMGAQEANLGANNQPQEPSQKSNVVTDNSDAYTSDGAVVKDSNQSNVHTRSLESAVASMQRGLMTDRTDMPSNKKFLEVKLKLVQRMTSLGVSSTTAKFQQTTKTFVRVDTFENSQFPKMDTRYGYHCGTSDCMALSTAFSIKRSGRHNISFDNEAEKTLMETVMLRDVYMPRVIVDSQVVDFDRSVSFLEKAYGVVVLRNPAMLPAEWCFVPCYDTMQYGPPGMKVTPKSGIIQPGGVQLVKLRQTVNVQVLRDPTCLAQHLVIHVMTGGDYTLKPHIKYRRSCFGMPLDELVQLAQPVGRRFAQTDSQSQQQQQQKQQQQQQRQQQLRQQKRTNEQKQPMSQHNRRDATFQRTDQHFGNYTENSFAAARGPSSHSLSAKYRFYALPSRMAQTSPTHCFLIPKELKNLVETARRSCLKKPDLFRRGGYHRDLQEIRWLLDNVESWNAESRISNVSAYSILEAIVLFFDCLPDSLFPSQLYSTIMDASKNFKNSLEIYNCLPEINANVFVYLITFLKLVHAHSVENDTDLPLFANTFADVLIKPPAALSMSQIPKSDRDSKRKFLGYFLANDVSHLFQIDLLLTRDEYPPLARHLVRIGAD